jgi:ATP-dependent DNA helicase PIF1
MHTLPSDIALGVSSSGIAAQLLNEGSTAHSQFKIPLEVDETTYCNFSAQSDLAELCRQAKFILWDEVSMMQKHCYTTLKRTLEDITGIDDWGGKVVGMTGDLRQTLPVVKRGSPGQIVNACIGNAPFWKDVKKMSLTRNMRIERAMAAARAEMESFNDMQMQIGDGVDADGRPSDTVEIPADMVVGSEDDLIESVFPDVDNPGANAAILCPKNVGCDGLNDKIIDKVAGQCVELLSVDTLLDTEDTVAPGSRNLYHDYPVEYLNSLSFSGLPPHKLRLKLGPIIMLLRNMDLLQGLCNGLQIKRSRQRFSSARLLLESSLGTL